MPLNFLLWNCLAPGKTSFGEHGKTASLKPAGDECVLTFAVDNNQFRTRFNVTQVCDSLFFYLSEQKGPIVLLVELKGGDIEHAAEQLADTLTAVSSALNQRQLTAEYRAIVIASGSALKKARPLQKEFEKQHGIPLTVTRKGDLRPYL